MKTTSTDPQKMTASTSTLRAKSSKPFFTNTASPQQPFFTASRTHTAEIEHAGIETDTFFGDVSRQCTDCEKTIEPETQDKPKDMPYVTQYPALKASNHCEPKQADFNKIPSGTLACGWTGGKFGAPFNMVATFVPNIPCTCLCGEYRQYVRGFFKVNGTKATHRLCGNTMSETTYYEDCASIGGTTYKYGYRSIKFGNSYFDKPDQKTGCVFNGKDHPGIGTASLPKGTSLEIKLDFIGVLVDACNADKILKTASWSVAGKGLVP